MVASALPAIWRTLGFLSSSRGMFLLTQCLHTASITASQRISADTASQRISAASTLPVTPQSSKPRTQVWAHEAKNQVATDRTHLVGAASLT